MEGSWWLSYYELILVSCDLSVIDFGDAAGDVPIRRLVWFETTEDYRGRE